MTSTIFSTPTSEWMRLSGLTDKMQPKMRLAFLRATRSGKIDTEELTRSIAQIVGQSADTSASQSGLIFDTSDPTYMLLVENLVSQYKSLLDDKESKQAARNEAGENKLVNTTGLDRFSATRLQRAANSGMSKTELEKLRKKMLQQRGNLIANTETNRAINSALDALWYVNAAGREVTKSITTRRDGRVCPYCLPLEGIQEAVGASFDTKYGVFQYPPFHPQCRCFLFFEVK